MSYTLEDQWRDEAYEAMSRELYPEHREQAIGEFTSERLSSFYRQNPEVAVSAVLTLKEARQLLEHGHHSASLVFAVSCIEQFLKAALLKPVIYGLVHTEALSTLVVDLAFPQNGGLGRYKKLLTGLFEELAGININNVQREVSKKPLLDEVQELQDVRNKVVHQGATANHIQAQHAVDVANAVLSLIFVHLLAKLGFQIVKGGCIVAILD